MTAGQAVADSLTCGGEHPSVGWARWAGMALAVLGGLGTFLFLPIYPFWSIVVIAVDVFIIWALATSRKHQEI